MGAAALPTPPLGIEVSAPGQDRLTVPHRARLIAADDMPPRETRGGAGRGTSSPPAGGPGVIVHWVAVVVLFLALLSCLVATRIAVVRMGRCVAMAGQDRHGKEKIIKPEGNSSKPDDHTSGNDDKAAALLFLVLSVLVPYSLTLLRSIWFGCGSDRLWPSCKAIALGIFGALLESAGVSLFLLQFLFSSTFPYITLVTGASGVFLIPSLVTMVTMARSGSRGKRVRLFCLSLSSVLCVAGIVLTVRPWKYDLLNRVSLSLPLAVALLSLAWCPALLRRQLVPSRRRADEQQRARQAADCSQDASLPPSGEATLDLETAVVMDTTLNARWKSSIVTSVVKVVAVPLFCALLLPILQPENTLTLADLGEGFRMMNVSHVSFPWFLVTIFCGLGSYAFGRVACVTCFKKQCFATALGLASALSLIVAAAAFDGATAAVTANDGFYLGGAVCLAMAQLAAAIGFAWETQPIPMQKESQLFWLPGYNGLFVDQWLLLDSRGPPSSLPHDIESTNDQLDPVARARRIRILICSTMYRETLFEMKQLMKSFNEINEAKQRSDRNIQAHIFFDNGVRETRPSDFALQLITAIEDSLNVVCENCTKVMTPYGLRLTWQLPSMIRGKSGMILTLHLKDRLKVKAKKRWSQVMYMSYVLHYIAQEEGDCDDDVFILTTDADVRFSPESVESLLDLMIRDPCVGAVSARTFPKGFGPVYWYQIFDYAIGHWLQKAAEHVLGTVLCSPGCFSVYRAAALKDVLPTYCSEVKCASEFLTKDMGEDRWLCTLMIQSGWRLEYCAAAGISTCCPVDFDEFFRQRRRWIPSTLANQIVLLREWQTVANTNRQVSRLFMIYEAILLFSTLANPSVCILIVVGGLFYAWNANMIATLIIMLLISIGYLLVCLYGSQELQLKVAKVLTYVFALVMVAVVIGVAAQIVGQHENGGHDAGTLIPSTFDNRTTIHPTNITTTTTTKKPRFTRGAKHCGHAKSLCGGMKNAKQEFNTDLEAPSNALPGEADTGRKTNVTTMTTTTTLHPPLTTSSGSGRDKNKELPLTASTIFLAMLTAIFLLTALVHPREAHCLLHGVWYLLCLPSSSVVLMIYSVCNITERSWGTREERKTDIGGTVSIWERFTTAMRGLFGRDVRTSQTCPPDPPSIESHQRPAVEDGCPEFDHVPAGGTGDGNEEGASCPLRGRHYRPRGRVIDNQNFQSAGIEDRPKRIREWLPADLADLYGSAFEESGYESTSFVASMTEADLISIGVRSKAHRSAILSAVQLLPEPDIEPDVPLDVRSWLHAIELDDYFPNFCRSHLLTSRSLDVLKKMTRRDLTTELRITKQGHLKRLILALTKLRNPTKLEQAMSKVKLEIEALPLYQLANVNRADFDFWVELRQDFLLPDEPFSQELDLRVELESLRNQSIMCLGLINFMWIILTMTLISDTQLNVPVFNTNVLGLVFLIVFAVIIVIQFFSMLIHRFTTWSHMIARTPSRFGDPYNVSFDFNDLNLSGAHGSYEPHVISELEQTISDVDALNHKREVNEEQVSRYRKFVEKCKDVRRLRFEEDTNNDEERRSLLMSIEESGARSEAENEIV